MLTYEITTEKMHPAPSHSRSPIDVAVDAGLLSTIRIKAFSPGDALRRFERDVLTDENRRFDVGRRVVKIEEIPEDPSVCPSFTGLEVPIDAKAVAMFSQPVTERLTEETFWRYVDRDGVLAITVIVNADEYMRNHAPDASYAPDPDDPENHGDFIARKFLPVDEDDSSRIHVEEVTALHDHKSEIIAVIPADASDWNDRDAKLIINYSCGIEDPVDFLERI